MTTSHDANPTHNPMPPPKMIVKRLDDGWHWHCPHCKYSTVIAAQWAIAFNAAAWHWQQCVINRQIAT